jgi:hypothetical protein
MVMVEQIPSWETALHTGRLIGEEVLPVVRYKTSVSDLKSIRGKSEDYTP